MRRAAPFQTESKTKLADPPQQQLDAVGEKIEPTRVWLTSKPQAENVVANLASLLTIDVQTQPTM
jgi:hypothetical protein